MSQENVEVVRRIYEDGVFDQHPEELLALVTPDIEFVNPPEAVEPGTRRGIAEVAQALQSISQSFDSYRHELHELFDAGDAVVAWVSFCTRSGGSETEVIQQEAQTWTFRGGKIVRYEWGRDLDAALEAAGLRE
jgi:ketosteroid isomerase-like protein